MYYKCQEGQQEVIFYKKDKDIYKMELSIYRISNCSFAFFCDYYLNCTLRKFLVILMRKFEGLFRNSLLHIYFERLRIVEVM